MIGAFIWATAMWCALHHRTILLCLLLAGLVIGTVGWVGDQFEIKPFWFEIVGFVIVIPVAVYLKATGGRHV